MRVGLQVNNFTWPTGQARLGEEFGAIAERAERAGFYSLWVMDHFYQIGNLGPAEHEMLEAYTTLGFAAGRTSRIKLGSLVTGVTYRYPGLLIKTVTTLDVLSGGRAYFGIGAAWNGQEHEGLGVPFPDTKERFEWLEDTLQIAHQMWSGEDKPFDGKRAHLGRTLNSPQAITKPHPPILIGGTGEQKTLQVRRAVRRRLQPLRAHGRRHPQAEARHPAWPLREGGPALRGDREDLAGSHPSEPRWRQRDADARRRSSSGSHISRRWASIRASSACRDPTDPEAFELLGAEIIPEVEKIRPAGR